MTLFINGEAIHFSEFEMITLEIRHVKTMSDFTFISNSIWLWLELKSLSHFEQFNCWHISHSLD